MSIRRHTIYNLAGATIPIAVSLVTVPIYLHQVGEARFGILSVAWLLLGYFGLFDLGLGMATSQQIAARHREGRRAQAGIFWTALLTNAALGIVGGLIAWPVAIYYFGHVIKVSADLRAEMLAATPWLVLAVPMATITGVATGTLQGLNRFGSLNFISVVGTILFQVLPLAAALFWFPSLTILLPVALAARLLTLLMLWADCQRSLLAGQPIGYVRRDIRGLIHFGFWVTVSSFFAPLVTMADRLLIGARISAAAVSFYVVPLNLGDRLSILGNSLGSALFPRFSALEKSETLALAKEAERILIAITLVVVVAAVFCIKPFLTLWVGQAFSSQSAGAGQILMVGVLFDTVSRVPLYALRGQGRPAAVAKIDLIQLVPVGAALYVLLVRFGLEGVACAYVFRVTLNYLLLDRELGTMSSIALPLLGSGVLLGLSLFLVRSLEPLSWKWLIAFLGVAAASCALAWIILPPSRRESILTRLAPRVVR